MTQPPNEIAAASQGSAGSSGAADHVHLEHTSPPVRVNVEQASYKYAGRQTPQKFTLEATTFQARQREFVAILGPNASGKSTLLKLVSGSLAPLSGRVELDGFETSRLDARTRAQRIAIVQQESPLVFPIRAGDYVLQGRHPHGRSLWFEKDEDYDIATNALAQVGAEHLRDRWVHEISGGEKQRVVLARAIAQQPLVLLLDEPTLHLDIGAQVELLARLRRLAGENRYTVIVVTHELGLAAEFADQIVLLHRGKCLRVGPPAAVYERELLERVFETPLDIDIGPEGRPRVQIQGRRSMPSS
ncbi:MAG TPA: ABC transporter ATP-binding protein [Candidatus Acidoferrales bacterium]